jgi:hypothetical protein
MLTTYLTQTRQLLQNPAAPAALYATSDLAGWINTARGQCAGDGEAIRFFGTIPTVLNQRNYQFSAISTGTAGTTGVEGVFHVRTVRYAVASGFQFVYSRAWEWFEFFYMNNPVPTTGPPFDWAQHKQGSAGTGTGSSGTGSFYLEPLPDQIYQLTLDCVCYPQPLVTDGDVEALPYPWTDAVPYYAAYLALLSAQTNARAADAERYFGLYQQFAQRARQFSNPALSRGQWEQSIDLTQTNKLGLSKSAGG